MSQPTPRVSQRSGVEVAGPVGVLEAAIDTAAPPAVATAVICHPHPLQQGAMTNKVVTTVARAFTRLGADGVSASIFAASVDRPAFTPAASANATTRSPSWLGCASVGPIGRSTSAASRSAPPLR
jgi:hypothetical protein